MNSSAKEDSDQEAAYSWEKNLRSVYLVVQEIIQRGSYRTHRDMQETKNNISDWFITLRYY